MSLKNKALASTLWTALQQFGSQGIRFIVSIILARLLLPEEFGVIAMLSIFMGLGNALMNSGMTSSLVRAPEVDEEDYTTVFYFNLVVSVLVYLIMVMMAPYIAVFFKTPVLAQVIKVYCIGFVVNAFNMVQLARMTREMDFKTQFVVELPSILIGGIAGVAMAYYGLGVWSLVYSILLQNSLKSLQIWFWSSWRPKLAFSQEKFKLHFNYGYKLLFSGIIDTLYNNVYTIVIAKFFPLKEVGYYQRADSLKQLPVSNIGGILNRVTFPLFASIQEDKSRLKSVYRQIMRLVIYAVTPILCIAAGLGEPLFRFLLTDKWLPAVPYFQILCLSGILYPLHAYNLNILTVKGRTDLFLRLEVIKKAMAIIILVVSFRWGIYGLLYGSVLASVLSFFVNTYYSGSFIGYGLVEQLKSISPIIVLGMLTGIGVYFLDVSFFAPLSLFLRLVLGTLIGLAVFVGSCEWSRTYRVREWLALIKRT